MPSGVYRRERREPPVATFGGLVAQARAVGEARQQQAEGVEGAGPALRGSLLSLAEVADKLADRGRA